MTGAGRHAALDQVLGCRFIGAGTVRAVVQVAAARFLRDAHYRGLGGIPCSPESHLRGRAGTPPTKANRCSPILEATSYFLNKEEVLLKERVSRSGPRKAASAKPARVQSFRQERYLGPQFDRRRPRPSLRARTTSQIQARGRTVEPANPRNPRPNPVPWRSTWVSWRRGPWRPGWLISTTASDPWACPACSLRNPGVVQAWFPIIDPLPTG